MNKFFNPDKFKTFFIVLMIFISTAAIGQQKFSMELKNVSVKTALETLKDKSTYSLWYSAEDVDLKKTISIQLRNGSVKEALEQILAGQNLYYSINGKQVVIQKEKPEQKPKAITGYVYDSKTNAPIYGAIVLIKGDNAYTTTDENGQYNILAPAGTLLEANIMGYNTAEKLVGNSNTINFILDEQVIALNEVLVTGFQTISRERSTGAATIVSNENLNKIQSNNITSKLEGSVPGLTSYNGNLSIRGTSSFAINSTPLLVLDGQPITGVNINELNPEDIQSITVLKDAAATSLYGVRASNGVIVVTTKKGNTKKPSINISAGFYFTPQQSLDYQHYASTGDIMDYEIDYMLNNPTYQKDPKGYFTNLNGMDSPQRLSQVQYLYFKLNEGELSQSEVNARLQKIRNNDYRKEYRDQMTQMNFTQDYNLSIAKGDDHSNIFFSARFEDRGSYDKTASFNKISLYLKNELRLTRWLKLTYGANLATSKNKYGFGDYQTMASSAMPYDQIFNQDGSPFYIYPYNYYRAQSINEKEGLKFMGYNAYEEARLNTYTGKDLYWKAFGQADVTIIEGLTAGVKFQYEDRLQDGEKYNQADSYTMRELINKFAANNKNGGYTYYIPEGGHMSETHARYSYMNLRAQIDYKKTFSKKHDFTALLGGEIREDNFRHTAGERYGYDEQRLSFLQVDYKTLQNGVIGQLNNKSMQYSEVVGVRETKHRYVSAYFNAAYSYDARYALNASVRIEQADLFGSDPKYRYRPLWSVGASWNVTNEAFLKQTKWLDMLKVRATYGITGNVDQSSSPYLLGQYITSPYSNSNLTSISTPPNKSLRWEKTSTFNVGIDFMAFRRLSGSIDFYNRNSSDLLAMKSLDPSTGFPEGKMNNGAMRNTGVELNLSYTWINNKDWNFTTAFTASYNKNKITEVGYLPTDALRMMQYPTGNYLQGDVYNSLYAYQYAGLTDKGNPSIYNEKGEIVDGTPVRDIDALICAGQLDPKWNGALDLSLRWKSLSLFAKIVYYAGHSLRADATPLYSGVTNGAMHEDLANRWTPEHTNTDIPNMNVYGNAGDRDVQWRYSDYQVVSASFIKMRNIGISYSFPAKWITKCGFQGINLKAQVNNPFYWSANNRDIDPEAFNANWGTRGGEQVTNYTLGININF